LGDLRLGVVGQDTGAATCGQLGAQPLIAHQAEQRLAQRSHIVLGEEQARVADDVGDLATGGADDRHAAGHGLNQHPAKLLLPVGSAARGQYQRI